MRPKRLISLLVAVCMMITMLPLSAVTAFAADTSSSTGGTASVDGYKYEYKVNEADNTATITKFLGPDGSAKSTGSYDIKIPEKIHEKSGDYTVTSLGEYSFSGTYSPDHQTNHNLISFCNQIQSVTIPESVTSIGKSAFEDCSNLVSLTIKGAATSIGAYAFASCGSLTSLSLAGSFQTIGDYAFSYCGMTSLTIDANITSIGNYAFSSCNSLTSLSLTGKVQKIGDYAFAYCTFLTSLSSLKGDIQEIGDYAFYKCSALYTATLSKSLTSIGSHAFADAFASCTSLDSSIEIPGTVTKIGDYAFTGAGLTSVTIDEGVKSTGKLMFYQCSKLKTVKFPESLTAIGYGSFWGCSDLEYVTIPDSVVSVDNFAFANCTLLSKVTLSDGVKTIGKEAFEGCTSLTSITLPDSVTTIGSITLPDSVTTIGENAFDSCKKIVSITIPKNVTTIKSGTFDYCSNLKSITLPAGLTSFQDDLTRCPAGCVIYYKNYKTAADALRDNNTVLQEDILAGHNFLYLCNVTFDANGGDPTDYPEVSVYKTEKITKTKANELTENDLNAINAPTRAGYKFTGWYTENDQPFDVNNTAITEDITLYAGWEPDPNAPSCHPLTVTGGTITVKYDGSDVTSKLNSNINAATGQKTYSVPEGAEVTVKLDQTAVPNGKVFDGWSTGDFSLPTGDYKAESITFTMSSGVNVSATYRDAATDPTPDTAVCHLLTLKDGVITSVTVPGKDGADPEDITEIVKKNANEDGSFNVPEGATVSVAFDKDAFADSGLKFGHWDITGLDDPNAYQNKESFDFVMPAKGVTLKAMTQDASIEDDEPDIVGPIVIGTTVVVGGAVLGYQAYSLGAEFAGKLLNLPYFPSNRSALAMMLWEDAGKPMPESELLYPDVGQEERDMDLQHAARWAMENELIPDLNDEGTAPEEMKFFPANSVSKLDVLNAWQKAQELKNN